MKCSSLVITFLLITLALSARGFDGERKGLVLSAGFGFAPLIKTSSGFLEANNSGSGQHFLIGYAWDNSNIIGFEGNTSIARDYEAKINGQIDKYYGLTLTQGFGGVTWNHYFGSIGKSIFSTTRIGLYDYGFMTSNGNDAGLGAIVGGGYEFLRHWQAGIYFSFGSINLDNSNLNLLISAAAF